MDQTATKGPYGNQLAEAIWRKRTTVKAVADAAGMSRQDASEVVNGHRLPSAEQLDSFVVFLGWTDEELYPTPEFLAAIAATRKTDIT